MFCSHIVGVIDNDWMNLPPLYDRRELCLDVFFISMYSPSMNVVKASIENTYGWIDNRRMHWYKGLSSHLRLILLLLLHYSTGNKFTLGNLISNILESLYFFRKEIIWFYPCYFTFQSLHLLNSIKLYYW